MAADMSGKKEKIAFVVIRYGREINGGAEYHCRMLAERLAGDYDVEVLTTCVKNYVTGENEYPEGEEMLNGVRVRRFLAEPFDAAAHRNCVRRAAPAKKLRHLLYRFRLLRPLSHLKPVWHYKESEEVAALNTQACYSPKLNAFICENKAAYKAIIPLSFFPHTYYAALYAPERTLLIPTMHNNGSSFRSIITSVFTRVAYIAFNTRAEQRLMERIVGRGMAPHGVVGVGIERTSPADWETTRAKYALPDEYLLYVGRIDPMKLNHIVDYFLLYKRRNPASRLKLVLMGGVFGKTVSHSDLLYTGFVSEAEKTAILRGAVAVVNPSRYESLSLILLEAMNEGKAMLVNGRCEVLKEHCVRSGGAALYYKGGKDFIRKLRRIESSASLRDEMGEKGQRYVEGEYGWAQVLHRMKRAIESINRGGVGI